MKAFIISLVYILIVNHSVALSNWEFKTITKGGITITYAIVLPQNYISNKAHPLLITLPPGGQNKYMVELGLKDYWAAEGSNRGWIIVSPIRSAYPFSSNQFMPTLIEHIKENYLIDQKEIHLAGNSNGGLSSFRVVLKHPDLFKSISVLAGYTGSISDLHRIKHITFNLFVGENDRGWKNSMEKMLPELKRLKADVLWKVVHGEGHEIQSLKGGGEIYDAIERHRND